MNEKSFWSDWVKPQLNNAQQDCAWKVQDIHVPGLPDVIACLGGVAMLLELKFIPKWPVRSSTPIKIDLRPNQRAFLRTWRRAHGHAFVVVGIDHDVFVFSDEVPEVIPYLDLHRPDPAPLNHWHLATLARRGPLSSDLRAVLRHLALGPGS